MSNKWQAFHGAITAELAEAEQESQRLFSRPPRQPSPEVVRMLADTEQRKQRR